VRWQRCHRGSGFFSNIDQETAAVRPFQKRYRIIRVPPSHPISCGRFRHFVCQCLREESGNSLFSTPYFRTTHGLLANWSLGYDPTRYVTENQSFGALIKYRQDFAPLRARLIVGIDLDHSPGSRKEDSITTTRRGDYYTGYSRGARVYDYDVTYNGISPYIHGEISPLERCA
jgi:hypothetical protein